MGTKKTTEQDSLYDNLDKMTSLQIVRNINTEDKKVAIAIERNLKKIAKIIDLVSSKINRGGRLFYIGAGTSGKVADLDSSDCPSTYGINKNTIIALQTDGNKEDDKQQGWNILKKHKVAVLDTVIGLTASGETAYVIETIKNCKKHKVETVGISCNKNSLLSSIVNYPIEIIVGPEFVTGSTRMKSATMQKMVLNMISTGVMIKLGKVKGSKMVNMSLSNKKLLDRGVKILQQEYKISDAEALKLLQKFGSVSAAIKSLK